MIKTTCIYYLHDPNTYKIRYIGKADNPKRRLQFHLSEAKNTKRKSHKLNWLRILLKNEQKPVLRIVDNEIPVDKWEWYEQQHIKLAKEIGCKLTNGTDGGEGGIGCKHSDETRMKISLANKGKKRTDESKKKLKIISSNRSDELKKRFTNKGNKHTEEAKKKMSLARKGRISWNKGLTKETDERVKNNYLKKGDRI